MPVWNQETWGTACGSVDVIDDLPGRARARTTAFLARFPAEMLALHRLNHPNIVTVYDAGVANGSAWYAMELVEGADCVNKTNAHWEKSSGLCPKTRCTGGR